MAYSKHTWHDDPATDTPISAVRLGHIEDGIEAATVTADAAETPAGAQAKADAAAAASQPVNANLATIAALDSATAGALVTDGSGWIRKTYAQLKTALGLVKGDVGLGNVDNTSDASKPISTATQTALDLKAPLASPAFTGTPTKSGSPLITQADAAGTFMTVVDCGSDADTPRPAGAILVTWLCDFGTVPVNKTDEDPVITRPEPAPPESPVTWVAPENPYGTYWIYGSDEPILIPAGTTLPALDGTLPLVSSVVSVHFFVVGTATTAVDAWNLFEDGYTSAFYDGTFDGANPIPTEQLMWIAVEVNDNGDGDPDRTNVADIGKAYVLDVLT